MKRSSSRRAGTSNNDHRDRRHYDTKIAEAFAEMHRVVVDDGVVTIVFGHGEPEVWQRLWQRSTTLV